jgi:hypothetical protein
MDRERLRWRRAKLYKYSESISRNDFFARAFCRLETAMHARYLPKRR